MRAAHLVLLQAALPSRDREPISCIKPQASPPSAPFLLHTKASRLTPRVGRLLTASISLDEFLDFTSGYEDPQFTIPLWNIPPSPCVSFQAKPSSSSGNHSNSAQEPDVYGSRSINWDFTLYPTVDTSGLFSEQTPLSEPNSLPLSSSSSAALASNLTSPDLPLNDTPDWTSLGNDSQGLMGGLAGGLNLYTMPQEQLNILAMSTVAHAADSSTPMVKDHSSSGSGSSPEQSAARHHSSRTSPLAPESSKIEKRKANTMAARRYRQKRVDQMSSLESELKDVKTERDDLKVRCARLEGEVETLRALLQARK
ncbi:hypothetical protein BKA63DRAFT_572602 [Paraphoma chrysanthemicola]|nr:hypothetical protein BKA63DRAFT_572602 [Paraphoma chrysanthemicola]